MERDTAGRPCDARGPRSLPAAAYERAEQFLPWHIGRSLLGMTVDPHWLDGEERFWYHAPTCRGGTFVVVDPRRRTREPAFDHARLAASLSRSAGTQYEAGTLPFDRIEFVRGGSAIEFDVGAVRWAYDPDGGTCERQDRTADRGGTTSPDGRWTVFVEDDNLRIRSTETGDVRALTANGRPERNYGTPLASPLEAAGIPAPETPPAPAVLWSPDSRRILTYRLDRRAGGTYHLVQSVPRNGSRRPVLHSYAYPLPGDDRVPTADLLVVDVERGASRAVRGEPVPLLYYGSPLRPDWIWWSRDGARIYAVTRGRGYRSYGLSVIDPESGESRVLVEEHGETAIEPHPSHSGGAPIIRVLDGGAQVLWYSTRDGWGHLYLYDLYDGRTGALRRQVTSGAWMVTDVLHVDESGRHVYFTAVGREPGRDPYFNHLYRVGLDGGTPTPLTPEDATHQISFAPSGAWFVDSFSRVDEPPVTVLRAKDGALLCDLERGDAGRLRELGWTPPERFCVKARDGTTDVYGVLIRPSNFHIESAGPLPILDSIYAGPQTNQAPTSFGGYSSVTAVPNKFRDLWHAQALAELGFAVVMIDGLGMPYRSKTFGDRSYRDLGDGGIADHVAAIRQLAQRYPYLDVDRVGIYGHSAGGYASTHAMLAFPEFYKVAVSSAGNHDHRLDKASWVERYMGLPVGDHYHDQSNVTLAHRLAGKLLLMHGEMDENVHPASTLQVVDALIAANKDFDLLILPNRPHGCTSDPYFVRRRWDYFVRHLLGAEPPAGYAITPDDAADRR
ncbi:MAG TPA: DPP IV N-terminal domain-containing protein [Chloroflexota bacterium]|nr:DPP IV N-terminal domain-containing protein [Chloroflexota bacterium]